MKNLTKYELSEALNIYFHGYKVVEYIKSNSILITVQNQTIRTDALTEIESMRPAGVLIHFRTATWLERIFWGDKRQWKEVLK